MVKAPSPSDYRAKVRNPHWERELRDWLRIQPEDARLAFLMELIDHQEIVALQLSHKTLEARESFVKLLDFAVSNRDASSIKFWMETVVPRLGFRRTADTLLRLSASEKEGVAKALYWLPRYAASDGDQIELGKLTEAISSQW